MVLWVVLHGVAVVVQLGRDLLPRHALDTKLRGPPDLGSVFGYVLGSGCHTLCLRRGVKRRGWLCTTLSRLGGGRVAVYASGALRVRLAHGLHAGHKQPVGLVENAGVSVLRIAWLFRPAL